MKLILLWFMLATSILTNKVFAQYDAYRFSISGQKVSFLLTGYYIEKVINAQEEDTILGSFQTGSGKITRLIAFGGSITDEMNRFLKSALPQSEGMLPLIVRINRIEILGITTSNRESSLTKMSLSFIRSDGGRFYHLFDAGTSIQQEGFDFTNALPGYTVYALQKCFADLRSAILLNHTDKREMTESELTSNPLNDPAGYPIFQSGKIQKGILHNFYDFRDCRADTNIPFLVHYFSGKDTSIRKARVNFPGSPGSEKIWGFCDGQDIYMSIGKNYYQLYPEKNRIISHVAMNDLTTADFTPIYLTFGLLGGLMAEGFANGVTDPAEDGYFKVDFCSGDLIPVDRPEFIDYNSKIIFHLSVSTDSSLSLCLFVNNTFHAKLKRGQFYTLKLPHKFSNVGIELRGEDNLHYAETIPVKKYKNDLYLIRLSNRKGILLERPSADIRSQLLEGMMLWNTVQRNEKETDPKCAK
jgi:hypothetical protein